MSCDGKTYTLPLKTWADGSAENAPEMSGFSANAGIAIEAANAATQMVLMSFTVRILIEIMFDQTLLIIHLILIKIKLKSDCSSIVSALPGMIIFDSLKRLQCTEAEDSRRLLVFCSVLIRFCHKRFAVDNLFLFRETRRTQCATAVSGCARQANACIAVVPG